MEPITQPEGNTTVDTTYGALLGRHGITVPAHLVEQAEVPVLTGHQRQGDILVRPVAVAPKDATVFGPVGAGVQVVHGEATGNTHWLHGDPTVLWARLDRGQVVGVVMVPEGSTAYLVHTDEHGCNGIGPGVYEVRRKREQADVERNVAD